MLPPLFHIHLVIPISLLRFFPPVFFFQAPLALSKVSDFASEAAHVGAPHFFMLCLGISIADPINSMFGLVNAVLGFF